MDEHLTKVNNQAYHTGRLMLSGAAKVRRLKKENAALKRQLAASKDRERAAWNTVKSTHAKYRRQFKKGKRTEGVKKELKKDLGCQTDIVDEFDLDLSLFPPLAVQIFSTPRTLGFLRDSFHWSSTRGTIAPTGWKSCWHH